MLRGRVTHDGEPVVPIQLVLRERYVPEINAEMLSWMIDMDANERESGA